MTQRTDAEVVRRMFDAFFAGDFETALSFYDPDVEWDGTNLPDGTISRGLEAIVDHIVRWADQWEDWSLDVERIVDAGAHRVVVVTRETGRSASGLTMDERHAELYTLREGKIIRRQGFSDPDEAFEVSRS